MLCYYFYPIVRGLSGRKRPGLFLEIWLGNFEKKPTKFTLLKNVSNLEINITKKLKT